MSETITISRLLFEIMIPFAIIGMISIIVSIIKHRLENKLNKLKSQKDSISTYNYLNYRKRKHASLEFCTTELIEWIGAEKDPVRLAVASCLINTGRWPDWLPGRLENYTSREEKERLTYIVAVYEILKNKSESISPNLYNYIWRTKYYCSYVYLDSSKLQKRE